VSLFGVGIKVSPLFKIRFDGMRVSLETSNYISHFVF